MTMKKKTPELHYTSPQMAKDLIALLPLGEGDIVLDAGSGRNKVWWKNLPEYVSAKECEIEDGNNFYEWEQDTDWVIGNPPYHESWKFTEKAITVATRGVAWLLNTNALNSHLTPARLQKLHEIGWHYSMIHVVADKRWFGRYFFLVLEKHPNQFISWEKKTY